MWVETELSHHMGPAHVMVLAPREKGKWQYREAKALVCFTFVYSNNTLNHQ
jgi:hypothetical protein